MQAEDRVIHFSTELIHPPVQHKKEVLQRLYFELSQTRLAAYDSTDFSNPAQVRFHSKRGKKSQSVAIFMPDRVVLVEEWADMAMNDFLEKVREVGSRALAARGLPCYVVHTATLRSTFALSHCDDARAFIIERCCGQQDKVNPFFQRPIATAGLRFVLPETNEDPGAFYVTAESFRHSRNEVFVEVKGIFGKRQVGAEEINVVLDNIRSVRSFISHRVYPYLNQFDQPRDTTS